MLCSAPHGSNRENTPLFHPQVNEVLFEFIQIIDSLLIHTSDDIPYHFFPHQALDGSLCHGKTILVATQPIMSLLETIQADAYGFQPDFHKTVAHLLVEHHAIAYHPPVETKFTDFLSTF